MPKKKETKPKAEKPKVGKKTVKPVAAAADTPADAGKAENSEPKQLPKYENAQVIEVLTENVHDQAFHRCKMSDGTTKDVPADLFQ